MADVAVQVGPVAGIVYLEVSERAEAEVLRLGAAPAYQGHQLSIALPAAEPTVPTVMHSVCLQVELPTIVTQL